MLYACDDVTKSFILVIVTLLIFKLILKKDHSWLVCNLFAWTQQLVSLTFVSRPTLEYNKHVVQTKNHFYLFLVLGLISTTPVMVCG
jgi:hypothetical protein